MTTSVRARRAQPTGSVLGRASARLRAGETAWVLPATAGMLVLAAVLYIVNLTVSGYADVYYSGAAWGASQSWAAWFQGAIDPAAFITVDKPPLSTMIMGLSVRIFGLSSASILPQALMGVATVALTMATMRRTFGASAAIIAGLVTGLTPAAVLIFRYNNPDALLTMLLVGVAYALVRALESDRLRWVALPASSSASPSTPSCSKRTPCCRRATRAVPVCATWRERPRRRTPAACGCGSGGGACAAPGPRSGGSARG